MLLDLKRGENASLRHRLGEHLGKTVVKEAPLAPSLKGESQGRSDLPLELFSD